MNEPTHRPGAIKRVRARLAKYVPNEPSETGVVHCAAVVSLGYSEARAVIRLGRGAWTLLHYRAQLPEGTPLIDIVRALAALRLITVKDAEYFASHLLTSLRERDRLVKITQARELLEHEGYRVTEKGG